MNIKEGRIWILRKEGCEGRKEGYGYEGRKATKEGRKAMKEGMIWRKEGCEGRKDMHTCIPTFCVYMHICGGCTTTYNCIHTHIYIYVHIFVYRLLRDKNLSVTPRFSLEKCHIEI